MAITYYLFLDKEFCIRNVFENLQQDILEPGIVYKDIKPNSILPPYIVIVSIYKDQYLLEKVTEQLEDIGYDKQFQLFKPLVKEKSITEF